MIFIRTLYYSTSIFYICIHTYVSNVHDISNLPSCAVKTALLLLFIMSYFIIVRGHLASYLFLVPYFINTQDSDWYI